MCLCEKSVCTCICIYISVALCCGSVAKFTLTLSTCLCVWLACKCVCVCMVCARHYADILKCPTRAVLTVCISINLSLASKVHSFSLSRCICTFIHNSKYNNNNSNNKGSAFHFRLCHLFARLQAQGGVAQRAAWTGTQNTLCDLLIKGNANGNGPNAAF